MNGLVDFLVVFVFGIPVFLVFMYLFFRLISSAIFKSWKEHFNSSKER